MEWYVIAIQKYAQFSGRSRRREYWTFALVNAIVMCLLYGTGISFFFAGQRVIGATLFGLCFAYAAAMIIPGLACGVRRLHDIGQSGWFMLLPLIPVAGGLILIVMHLLDSQPGPNPYGPNPKFPVQPMAIG
jgi:uncharacterized membrane protein YhaH (DUF805 family)